MNAGKAALKRHSRTAVAASDDTKA
jgi:hypothetical protein